MHGRLGGGYPPRLHPIMAHEHGRAVGTFVKSLFWRFDANTWCIELKRLLTATILMNLGRFIDLLLEHPQHAFGAVIADTWEKHKFLQCLGVAAGNANISNAVLLEWGSLVDRDFIERNLAFAPMERFDEVNPRQPTAGIDDR